MRGNKVRVAGLVSASGSTAAAVYQACLDGRLDAELPLVIVNHPRAAEKLRLLRTKPEIVIISSRGFDSRSAFGAAILEQLECFGIDCVGMWGWDPVVPDNVLTKYSGRIWNQHPDLTPWFGGQGMNGIVPVCARLNFARATGHEMAVEPVSHWATEVVDGGDIIKSGWTDIYPDDTCETLYERVKKEEHRVQIETVADAIAGRLREIGIISPVRPGEEEILAEARAKAFEHHAGAKQSTLKQTKG